MKIVQNTKINVRAALKSTAGGSKKFQKHWFFAFEPIVQASNLTRDGSNIKIPSTERVQVLKPELERVRPSALILGPSFERVRVSFCTSLIK